MAAARKPPRGAPAQKSGPRGVLFVAVAGGVLLGLAIALGFAVWLARQPSPFTVVDLPKQPLPPAVEHRELPTLAPESKPPAPPATAAPPVTASATARAPSETSQPATARPKFEYHDILTGRTDARPAPARPGDAAAARSVWFVQAGAFHNAADADNLKAKLALAGIEARIQTVGADGATRLHRVRVGPFARVEDADRMRGQLVENRFEGVVVPDKSAP
ncbi:MAG: SPOR domain-containing protein [Burkholderiales bacterium]|nr:SPOR domain-containing protein [Burkholderiales bacterium]